MSYSRHSAATRYAVVDGEISVGGIRLSRLAARVGRTPFYAYDRSLLVARMAELRALLPTTLSLHYAMKANPMPAVVGFMAGLVDGLDVASGGELLVALDTGTDPRQISFAGPGKSEVELMQSVAAGILVNVESRRELRLLAEVGSRLGLTPRVAIRVNPDFELKSSGMRMGGGAKQFGIDAEAVPDALAECAQLGLGFEGFHIFSGSQNLRVEAITEAQTKALALAIRLAQNAPSPVRTVNLGGGFGIPYFPGEQAIDLAPIGEHLRGLVVDAAAALPHVELVLELGRFLVGEAGVYVARVLDRKVSRGEVFLVIDGGLHHHLSASGNFGQVIRKNYPVEIGNRMGDVQREIASVVGPLCTPLDLLADRMELAVAQPGDLVVVYQSGAYGHSSSPTRFLSHPDAIQVLV
ncbi:pyridoxal-dependent decarboxylase, exosortase A system-associated [Piscinibacter defluvii]|uniref:pyridoxal-dependent decarboxylase, exosortase A system-associated n=1 Tax=Piscinibacter defluvii TaxID=1796922 RepID=UPI000FDEBC43|nr:pyridoxal-dependent decarboxylase, exosortase A system-associated [Piscinibacter defluvii]